MLVKRRPLRRLEQHGVAGRECRGEPPGGNGHREVPRRDDPDDAERLGGLLTGDLVRVETDIGHMVLKAWVTEGIRPGVVACSHHMGRWKLENHGQRQLMATVEMGKSGARRSLKRRRGVEPYESGDPDTSRIWWTDAGVHQNLTFPVHPDPISGMHCWHQAVRVRRADPTDNYADIAVDLEKADRVYREWLDKDPLRAARIARREPPPLLVAAPAEAGP